jgi:maleamate amidohydrolase
VVDAAAATVPLLAKARALRMPIIFTRVLFHPSGLDGGLFLRKVPVLSSLIEGEPLGEIVDELAPRAAELVIIKNYASAFFGTSLASTLVAAGCDSLILAGCSTSGCVRATAVDGMQHGFRVIVPRSCVGDRHAAPHEANLFDINAKYGDVIDLSALLTELNDMNRD